MDEGGIGTEIILVLMLLLANGAFALSEMAIVSARRTQLQQRAEDGDAGARRALELVEHPNRFLATVCAISGQKPDRRTTGPASGPARPLFVPETITALKLLELFRKTGVHFAMVIDEYGGTHGLATLNDVLEEITGDLVSPQETRFHRRDDGSWLVDASVSMDEFWTGLGLEERRAEDRYDYSTLGGFVLTQLGHLPREGEHFEALGLRFEVVDMDGRRVDKLIVAPVPEEPSGQDD